MIGNNAIVAFFSSNSAKLSCMRQLILIVGLSFSLVSCYDALESAPDGGDGGSAGGGAGGSGGPASRLSAYSSHYCKVTETGQVFCRGGKNEYGQLGNRALSESGFAEVLVKGVTARDVAVGYHHTCALLRDSRRVACWGRNDYGQAGVAGQDAVLEPTVVEGIENVTQIAGGVYHTCALDEGGDIYCWGMANDSETGPGYGDWTTGQTGPTPQLMPRIEKAAYLRTSTNTTCAVTDNGDARCWGVPLTPDDPAVKSGSYKARTVLTGVTDLSLGNAYLCYIKGTGLWCGSLNEKLELSLTSIPTVALKQVSSKSSEGPLCALATSGDLYCMDQPLVNRFGGSLAPAEEVTGAIDVAAGHLFFCALLGNGETKCRYGSVSDTTK
jgi:hypothetical protein